jgi:hypothetical protein
MNLPDLTTYGGGGLTLIVALYVVLQSLKRSHPRIAAHMPDIILAVAAVLIATVMWAPKAFVLLAGTLITAALVLGSHAVMKNMAQKPPDKPV